MVSTVKVTWRDLFMFTVNGDGFRRSPFNNAVLMGDRSSDDIRHLRTFESLPANKLAAH